MKIWSTHKMTHTRGRIALKPNDDGTITVEGERLNAAQVEALIHDLALARNGMSPEVPRSFSVLNHDVRLLVMTEPAIAVSRSQAGLITLSIRHGGLGWVALELPPRQALFLRNALDKRLAGVQTDVLDEDGPDRDTPQH
jgi:hypothetical protein